MRNLKKFLALVLAMMMTLSLMVTVNASSFSDDTDITKSYQEAVDVLTELGVINGYSDGTFLPKEKITRAEVAAIIYRLTTGDVSGKNAYRYENADYFTDVADGKWYNGYVNYCANNGLVLGVGNNRFEPSSNVTGYQALVMILRAMGYNNPQEFSNSDWKFKASGYGSRLGITKNIATGSLSGEATREMVAEIMFQAIQKPTVKYSILNDYQENVLVEAYKNDNGWVYAEDVYETLLYRTFKIVGKRTVMSFDNYGRPVQEWVKDNENDTVANGGLYVVNYEAPVDFTSPYTGGGTVNVNAGDVHCWRGDASTVGASYNHKDDKAKSVPLSDVYTFNTAMTECELSKAINNDTQIAWADITEYVNGHEVKNRDDAENGTMFDATHTTNTGTNKSDYTIGAQGRQTEIYKYSVYSPAVKKSVTKWVFVYIDTLLGEVVKVLPLKVDTAGHVMENAKLYIAVNGTVKNSGATVTDCVLYEDSGADFTQKVGDLVLLTSYGYAKANANKIASGQSTAVGVNEKILEAVPSGLTDFRTGAGTDADPYVWYVDLAFDSVGENWIVPTTTIQVKGTNGPAEDKTGVVDANGKAYPTTWAYHVDDSKLDDGTGTAVTDTTHTAADVRKDTVLKKYHTEITNSIINQTYTAALDKNGNIVGMWPGSASTMVGVITDADYARIGLGKYAVEFEVFTTESKTESVRLLDEYDTANSAPQAPNYFATQDDADSAILTPTNELGTLGAQAVVGNLVKLESYVKDGATYWKVVDSDTSPTDADASGGKDGTDTTVDLYPGRGNGLKANARDLDSDSVVIVAEYDFDYSAGTGNTGSNVNARYTVYNDFRTLPYITTTDTDNIVYQRLDKDGKYLLVYADDPQVSYNISKRPTIQVDDSFLVVAHGTTYAEYSEFIVAKNGKLETIKVANINDGAGGLNKKMQDAIRVSGLMIATSENSKGYITAVDLVENVNANDPNLGLLSSTLIAKNKTTYSKGVLTIAGTPDYLTVAENCQVKIVNVDQAKLYDATLDSLEQYADQDLVFELDTNGYVSYLYIID